MRTIRTVETRLLAVAVAVAASAACGTRADTAREGETATPGRPPVAVTTAPATTGELTETIEVVGSLSPKFSAEVKSEVSGIVTGVYVTEWVPVRKGAPLARLDTTETEAALNALKAVEAQALVAQARARREYERALQLAEYGLITPQARDEAKSALDAADAGAKAAHGQVRTAEARLAKSFINAPMDGVVAERHVNVGDRVENMGGDGPMFRIVDNRRLELTVTVPASQLMALGVGQRLEFTTEAEPGQLFTGEVMFINPAVDEASRSVKVLAEVPNTDGRLKGGLFAEGRIVVSSRPGVLQVPREALANWDAAAKTADLFVVSGGAAERRRVRTGTVHAGSVEITGGLQSGEQVVVRGGFALHPGDRVVVAGADKGA